VLTLISLQIISHSNYITSLLSTLQAQPTLAPFLAAPPSHIAGHLSDGTPIGLAPPTPAAKPKKGQPPRLAARPTSSAGGAAGSTSASASSSAALPPAATPPTKTAPTPKKRKADAEPAAASSSASRPPKKKAAPAATAQSSAKAVRGTPLPEEPRRPPPLGPPPGFEPVYATPAMGPQRARRPRVTNEDMDESEGEGEKRYCWCDNVSYGDMIGCDGDDCEREWVSAGRHALPSCAGACADCTLCRSSISGASACSSRHRAPGTAPTVSRSAR